MIALPSGALLVANKGNNMKPILTILMIFAVNAPAAVGKPTAITDTNTKTSILTFSTCTSSEPSEGFDPVVPQVLNMQLGKYIAQGYGVSLLSVSDLRTGLMPNEKVGYAYSVNLTIINALSSETKSLFFFNCSFPDARKPF